jgi:hypothetical protein
MKKHLGSLPLNSAMLQRVSLIFISHILTSQVHLKTYSHQPHLHFSKSELKLLFSIYMAHMLFTQPLFDPPSPFPRHDLPLLNPWCSPVALICPHLLPHLTPIIVVSHTMFQLLMVFGCTVLHYWLLNYAQHYNFDNCNETATQNAIQRILHMAKLSTE